MKFSDLFQLKGSTNGPNRTAVLRIRLFGIDFEFSLMGYLDDMIFPFLFVPTRRGLAIQVLFAGLFIGRPSARDSEPLYQSQEEEEW